MRAANIKKHPADFQTQRLPEFDASWTSRTLPSGLTLIHVPLPQRDHFFLGMTIKAGTRLESGLHPSGVSHFLEHMMFRGSARFPEFTRLAEAFEWLGGDWNAATSHEHTEYWYAGIKHTAPEVIALFADFLETPQLTDLEVERNIILRELDGETNDHGHSTDLDHHIANLIWPNTTIAQPILGTRETLAAIDVAALRAYRDAYYVPKNLAVCAVGGDEGVMDLLAQHFGEHRRGYASRPHTQFEILPAFHGPAVKWVEHSDNEYEVKLSFHCDGEWSPEAQSYDLLARILSDGFCSRLARRLREELGLVYDINAYTNLGLDTGTLDIWALCSQDGLDEFLRELFAVLRKLVEEGPAAEEVERAVVRSVVNLELSPSAPEEIGQRLAWAALNKRKLSLVTERERLIAVTPQSLANLARRLFRPETAALAVLGPADKDIEKRLKKAIVQGLG